MANFILWWFFLPRGGFLHSACAQGLNDNDATFLRIRLQFLKCFTLPRPLISLGCALPASPAGKLLYRAWGVDDIGLDGRFAGGKSDGCSQFLNWLPQDATGILHLDGFESYIGQNKKPPSESWWHFCFGGATQVISELKASSISFSVMVWVPSLKL